MAGRLLATIILICSLCLPVHAQAGGFLSDAPSWKQLNAQQRTALAPLAKEWNHLSDNTRSQWLGIAKRFAAMTDVEQARMQDRMREWVLLTPAQRELARIQYRQLHSTAQQHDLEEKWREYSALPEEEKARLRAGGRAVVKAPPPVPLPTASAPATGRLPLSRPPKALSLKGSATRPVLPPPAVTSPPVAEEPEEPDDSDF